MHASQTTIAYLSHKSNIVLNDAVSEASVFNSVKRFKASGGGAIVENSTFGLQRKNSFLKKLSEETGVHVVAGTGGRHVRTKLYPTEDLEIHSSINVQKYLLK